MDFKKIDELMKPSLPPIRWGNWIYDGSTFVLRHEPTDYEVDLDGCTDSAQVLDWIVQVSQKTLSAEDVGHLARALDTVLSLQSNVCGIGQDHTIDPRVVAKANGYDIGKPRAH